VRPQLVDDVTGAHRVFTDRHVRQRLHCRLEGAGESAAEEGDANALDAVVRLHFERDELALRAVRRQADDQGMVSGLVDQSSAGTGNFHLAPPCVRQITRISGVCADNEPVALTLPRADYLFKSMRRLARRR
jgi:hypothetical protein